MPASSMPPTIGRKAGLARELEGRFKPTVYDLAELARLRDLLKAPVAAMADRLTRKKITALTMAGFSGFLLGMAFYILVELALS
jgi:hypothetical protein